MHKIPIVSRISFDTTMAILASMNNHSSLVVADAPPKNERTTLKKKKSVSFQLIPRVRKYIHRSEIEEHEKSLAWYTESDLERIQKESQETVQRMAEGENTNSEEYCARGLENKTSLGARIYEKHRVDALEEVLEYQFFHQDSGVDPDRLAQAYSEYTAHSMRMARLMARIDADFKDEIIEESTEEIPEPQVISMMDTDYPCCYWFDTDVLNYSIIQFMIECYE